jgi:anaerobic selenocysteine-containing dehydrogenase
VVFVNPADIAEFGFADGDLVDLVTRWTDDDHERRASAFRIVAYQTPRGCAAAYYPETNALVPLDSTAEGSNTPTSKSIIVALIRPDTGRGSTSQGGQRPTGADDAHKRDPDPMHLS